MRLNFAEDLQNAMHKEKRLSNLTENTDLKLAFKLRILQYVN